MSNNRKTVIILAAAMASVTAVALLAEDQGDKPWKNKPVPEWTADDAHLVMTDSPWVKTTTPRMDRPAQQRRSGGVIDFKCYKISWISCRLHKFNLNVSTHLIDRIF